MYEEQLSPFFWNHPPIVKILSGVWHGGAHGTAIRAATKQSLEQAMFELGSLASDNPNQ